MKDEGIKTNDGGGVFPQNAMEALAGGILPDIFINAGITLPRQKRRRVFPAFQLEIDPVSLNDSASVMSQNQITEGGEAGWVKYLERRSIVIGNQNRMLIDMLDKRAAEISVY